VLNINGSGPNSDWLRVDTDAREREESTVPGAPTSMRPQAESTGISLSWTPPVDDGIMVRGYMIGWGVGVPDRHTHKVDPNQRYYRIEGLDPNREYVVSLRAYNRAGNGFPIFDTVRTLMPGAKTHDARVGQGTASGSSDADDYDEYSEAGWCCLCKCTLLMEQIWTIPLPQSPRQLACARLPCRRRI
jgi:hypothetical protein